MRDELSGVGLEGFEGASLNERFRWGGSFGISPSVRTEGERGD